MAGPVKTLWTSIFALDVVPDLVRISTEIFEFDLIPHFLKSGIKLVQLPMEFLHKLCNFIRSDTHKAIRGVLDAGC